MFVGQGGVMGGYLWSITADAVIARLNLEVLEIRRLVVPLPALVPDGLQGVPLTAKRSSRDC
jgi:hypothetical protein